MTNLKKFCLDCFAAKSEVELHEIVINSGFNDAKNWRPYGGSKNNATAFDNQQDSAEGALAEKIVDSHDAVLTRKCIEQCIVPENSNDPRRPKTMEEAVKMFFGVNGLEWDQIPEKDRRDLSNNVQVMADGDKEDTNITIVDCGEGQNPQSFPLTFLSLGRGNKLKIPFTQGKYCFGSTGALRFCGQMNYELIVSRRNTAMNDADGLIGFTLVRRHILSPDEELTQKMNWFEYLVIDDKIPSFKADSLDLGLYNGNLFYSGSVVRLYSYQLSSRSNIQFDLWRELNKLFFVPALPILIHEKRELSKERMLNTSTKVMYGNMARITKEKQKVKLAKQLILEGFWGYAIPAKVYVFDRSINKNEFIRNRPLDYILNGQVHASEGTSFVTESLNYYNLNQYLYVCVDLSSVGTSVRQGLFMASRDRIRKGTMYYRDLKNRLIEVLKNDEDLIRLDEEYKGLSLSATRDDNKIANNIFMQLNKVTFLKKLFLRSNNAKDQGNKTFMRTLRPSKVEQPKELKEYPTFLRLHNDVNEPSEIKIPIESSKTIVLDTDVNNDFFNNNIGKIEMAVNTGIDNWVEMDQQDKVKLLSRSLHNGHLQLCIKTTKSAQVGECISLTVALVWSSHIIRISNPIQIEIIERKEASRGGIKPSISFKPPELICVHKDKNGEWPEFGLNDESVVKLKLGRDGFVERVIINMDSNALQNELKRKNSNAERIIQKYKEDVYLDALLLLSL